MPMAGNQFFESNAAVRQGFMQANANVIDIAAAVLYETRGYT